jgi:hypothetical protein
VLAQEMVREKKFGAAFSLGFIFVNTLCLVLVVQANDSWVVHFPAIDSEGCVRNNGPGVNWFNMASRYFVD